MWSWLRSWSIVMIVVVVDFFVELKVEVEVEVEVTVTFFVLFIIFFCRTEARIGLNTSESLVLRCRNICKLFIEEGIEMGDQFLHPIRLKQG